jgi:predicted ribosomally synthesized peptide with nif11-like leader
LNKNKFNRRLDKMSLENAKKFLKEFKGNAEFRSSIENASDDETRQQLARDAGYDFTREEVKEVMGAEGGKISDSDLEAVAGGASSTMDNEPNIGAIIVAAAAAGA